MKTNMLPVCGDGLQYSPYEICDDGPKDAADSGCMTDCTVIKPGYVCTTGSSTSATVCSVKCGDNIFLSPEQCEDNNLVNDDGCDSTCKIETGYQIKTGTLAPHVMEPICGDGKKVGNENCDDGTSNALVHCKAGCLSGPIDGYVCSGGSATVKDTCTTVCGDGFFKGTEACDDGNIIPYDGCNQLCQKEAEWTLVQTTDTVTSVTEICGDGKVVGTENCDDGTGTAPVHCKAGCKTGQVNGYTCTGGNRTTATTCTLTGCGDGYILNAEECEDWNTVNGDGCSSTCMFETGWELVQHDNTVPDGKNKTIMKAKCADGLKLSVEACDDGNTDSNAATGCNVDCTGSNPGYLCHVVPGTTVSTCFIQCNDGVLLVPETCEDGNIANDDGCDATCQIEDGWRIKAGITIPHQMETICGDGKRAGTELCDDGVSAAVVNCKAACDGPKTGWHCSGGNPTTKDTCIVQCGDEYI